MTIQETIGVELGDDSLDEWVRPVSAGAIAGVGSFLLIYVANWLMIRGRVDAQFEGAVPTWKGVVWYTQNSHFVGLVTDNGFGPFTDGEATNLLELSVDVTTDVLFLLPPIVLLLAGALACVAIVGAPSLEQRLAVGAALTAVYVLLFVGLAILTSHHVEGIVFGQTVDATVQPSLFWSVLAGIAYPLVFATLGSFVMGELRQ